MKNLKRKSTFLTINFPNQWQSSCPDADFEHHTTKLPNLPKIMNLSSSTWDLTPQKMSEIQFGKPQIGKIYKVTQTMKVTKMNLMI